MAPVAESRFLKTFRLLILRDGAPLRQGTCWFVTPHSVVTAFHVVGDRTTEKWLSEFYTSIEYCLATDDLTAQHLLPLTKCVQSDLAVLTFGNSRYSGVPLPIAATSENLRDNEWFTTGYPFERRFEGMRFSLSGYVTDHFQDK